MTGASPSKLTVMALQVLEDPFLSPFLQCWQAFMLSVCTDCPLNIVVGDGRKRERKHTLEHPETKATAFVGCNLGTVVPSHLHFLFIRSKPLGAVCTQRQNTTPWQTFSKLWSQHIFTLEGIVRTHLLSDKEGCQLSVGPEQGKAPQQVQAVVQVALWYQRCL